MGQTLEAAAHQSGLLLQIFFLFLLNSYKHKLFYTQKCKTHFRPDLFRGGSKDIKQIIDVKQLHYQRLDVCDDVYKINSNCTKIFFTASEIFIVFHLLGFKSTVSLVYTSDFDLYLRLKADKLDLLLVFQAGRRAQRLGSPAPDRQEEVWRQAKDR